MSVLDPISIGSCLLCVIHCSFRKGFKWFIDESINDIWFWFSQFSTCREDFISAVNSINEVSSRFLSRFVVTR